MLNLSAQQAVVKAIREHQEQDLKLSEQLFHNYKVEGITDDGHKFEFTHQDPAIRKKLWLTDLKLILNLMMVTDA